MVQAERLPERNTKWAFNIYRRLPLKIKGPDLKVKMLRISREELHKLAAPAVISANSPHAHLGKADKRGSKSVNAAARHPLPMTVENVNQSYNGLSALVLAKK
jgi:hypothetical protein